MRLSAWLGLLIAGCAGPGPAHAEPHSDASPPLDAGLPDAQVRDAMAEASRREVRDASATDATRTVTQPAPHGCVRAEHVRAGRTTVACGELTHDLTVAERCLHEACGLILDVHGGTMSGAMQEKNTRLGERGSARGYVVVQPNAVARPLYNGDLLPQWEPDLDDTLVMRFLEDVSAAFQVDPDRVHVTGFSQGGLMTWRLVCAHAERFASAAPAAGSWPDDREQDCAFDARTRPARELPILNMQGTRDEHSPFTQALIKRDRVRAALEMDEGVVIAQDGDFVHTRYLNPRGVAFEFVQHDYATDAAYTFALWHEALEGHCYPGSDDWEATLPGQFMGFGCRPPTAFDWGSLVLDFFAAHPRR